MNLGRWRSVVILAVLILVYGVLRLQRAIHRSFRAQFGGIAAMEGAEEKNHPTDGADSKPYYLKKFYLFETHSVCQYAHSPIQLAGSLMVAVSFDYFCLSNLICLQ